MPCAKKVTVAELLDRPPPPDFRGIDTPVGCNLSEWMAVAAKLEEATYLAPEILPPPELVRPLAW